MSKNDRNLDNIKLFSDELIDAVENKEEESKGENYGKNKFGKVF